MKTKGAYEMAIWVVKMWKWSLQNIPLVRNLESVASIKQLENIKAVRSPLLQTYI